MKSLSIIFLLHVFKKIESANLYLNNAHCNALLCPSLCCSVDNLSCSTTQKCNIQCENFFCEESMICSKGKCVPQKKNSNIYILIIILLILAIIGVSVFAYLKISRRKSQTKDLKEELNKGVNINVETRRKSGIRFKSRKKSNIDVGVIPLNLNYASKDISQTNSSICYPKTASPFKNHKKDQDLNEKPQFNMKFHGEAITYQNKFQNYF